MSADYTVKVGVIPGPLVVRLSYADGSAPVPALTTPGTTAELRMRRVQGTTTLLVKAMTIVDADHVSCEWQADDWDVALQGTQAQVGTLRRALSLVTTATQTQTGTISRQVPGALTGTQAQVGSLVAGQGQQFLLTLSATQAQVGSFGAVPTAPIQKTTGAVVMTITSQAHPDNVASRAAITSSVAAGQTTVQRASTRAVVVVPDDA